MKAIVKELSDYLRDRAIFAFVYGSVLTKYFNAESDVDVAVYLGKRLAPHEFLRFKDRVTEDFGDQYEFDLVLLDTADPIITMQVLANGKLIVNNDNVTFIQYKARKISEYIDFKISRKIIEDRLAEGSIYA